MGVSESTSSGLKEAGSSSVRSIRAEGSGLGAEDLGHFIYLVMEARSILLATKRKGVGLRRKRKGGREAAQLGEGDKAV